MARRCRLYCASCRDLMWTHRPSPWNQPPSLRGRRRSCGGDCVSIFSIRFDTQESLSTSCTVPERKTKVSLHVKEGWRRCGSRQGQSLASTSTASRPVLFPNKGIWLDSSKDDMILRALRPYRGIYVLDHARQVTLRGLGHRSSTAALHQTTAAANAPPSPKPPLRLRPYQEECIESVLTAFAQGRRQVGVSLATGAGKTVSQSASAERRSRFLTPAM